MALDSLQSLPPKTARAGDDLVIASVPVTSPAGRRACPLDALRRTGHDRVADEQTSSRARRLWRGCADGAPHLVWRRDLQIDFSPADADLGAFLAACPADIPVLAVGAGSNLLVRDGGIAGVVIRLGEHMKTISHDGDIVTASAGATDADVARYAARNGLAGLEFLIGIPGTVGGGLRMNAGAYGGEFKDITIRAHGFDRSGTPVMATPAQMGMAYRHTDAPADWVFTHAEFRATAATSTPSRPA